MGKWIIDVEGFGKVKVKKPKRYTDKKMADALADAVMQSLNLARAYDEEQIFHPVMGEAKRKNFQW